MGYQDRDWYREHQRRSGATRQANTEAFGRSAGGDAKANRALSSKTGYGVPLFVWLVIGAIVMATSAVVLKHRHAARPVESVLPVGVPVGRLHIVSRPVDRTAIVELRQINPANAEVGVNWTIIVPPGSSFDRYIPVGRYRARVSHEARFFGFSSATEFVEPIQIWPSTLSGGGTLQI